MDSSSIASVVGKDFPQVPFKTFTIYYEGRDQMDERAWASEVPSTYSNIKPIYYAPSDREVAECFEAVSKAHDVPLRASPAISGYLLAKLAAKSGVKVLLDGTGADAYLPDWLAYDRLIGGQIRRGRLLRALRLLRDARRERSMDLANLVVLGLKSVVAAALSDALIWQGRALFEGARPMKDKTLSSNKRKFHSSRQNQYSYHLLFHAFLASFLQSADRMSMASSIECRVPFLDHRLVEIAFALDDEDKIRHGQGKFILRKSMEGIVPNKILARRDKQPFFGQEMAAWLSGPLRHLIEPPMTFDGIENINQRVVEREIKNFKEGDQNNAWLVWRLAMLNHWAQSQ